MIDKKLQVLFWERVSRQGEDDCWEWIGTKFPEGYGVIQFNNKPYKAHRLSYMIHTGEDLSSDIAVCHTCDNRGCVNPKHLWLGSFADNARDMWSKGRGNPIRLAGEESPSAKLTKKQVDEIRRRWKAGRLDQNELADMFGISHSQINRIVNYKGWKD